MNDFKPLLHSLRGDTRTRLIATESRTGRQMADCIERLADALQATGVHCIASRLDNGPQWLLLDLAIRRLGAVHVPLPTFFTEAQMGHALHSSGADCLVSVGDRGRPLAQGLSAAALDPVPVALPAGTACITYTSGTTGQPKGVCLDAATLLTVAASLEQVTRPLRPRRHLCLMPLSTLLENVAGLYAALLADADIIVPPLAEIGYTGSAGLDVSLLLACLHRHQPHSIIMLPQLLLALVMAGEAGLPLPSSLRCIAVGGGRVGQGLIERAMALGLPVYEGYGLTECASVVCLNRADARRPGSVGLPLPHARVLEADGELLVDGVRCLGYLGLDGPPPGPIATGDLGHVDAQGFVHITGRRKHVFITAYGRNVSPDWVESELLQHPLFAQAVVTGEARPYNVAVTWLRRPDADPRSVRMALDAVNRGLPDYAQIADIVPADEPFSLANGLLTANGRVRRDAVCARYADAIADCYSASLPHPTPIPA